MSSVVQYNYPNHSVNVSNISSGGDPITQLPVDQNPPSPMELQIVDTLFKKHRKTMDIIFDEAKDAIIVTILIIIFCLPQVDNMIKKFLPIANRSLYILVLFKGLVAAILFWLIKHFYLSRKSF